MNVIAPESITADSLTKVVSVLGPEQGLKYIDDVPHVAARVMRAPEGNLEIRESPGFAAYYERN